MGGVCLRHEKIFKKGQHNFHTLTVVLDLLASKFDFSYYSFIGFDCARHLCDSCASFVGEELKPCMMVIKF